MEDTNALEGAVTLCDAPLRAGPGAVSAVPGGGEATVPGGVGPAGPAEGAGVDPSGGCEGGERDGVRVGDEDGTGASAGDDVDGDGEVAGG